MTKDYMANTAELFNNVKELGKVLPDVMKGFQSTMALAWEDGAVSKKTKDLIAIALAVSAGCEGCIGVHSQSLVKLGVTRQELAEVLGVAIFMGGGPAVMREGEALKAFDQFNAAKE